MLSRRIALGLLLALPGCGRGEPGFFIDLITLSPSEIPVNSTSNERLRVAASIFNDRHEVDAAWASCDEGPIWIDLAPGNEPRWSGSVPVAALTGIVVGNYYLDLHATDLGGRQVDLENSIRLRINED